MRARPLDRAAGVAVAAPLALLGSRATAGGGCSTTGHDTDDQSTEGVPGEAEKGGLATRGSRARTLRPSGRAHPEDGFFESALP